MGKLDTLVDALQRTVRTLRTTARSLVAGSGIAIVDNGTTATISATGTSGDNVSVNGTSCSDANFDNITPAAPAGNLNVKWQKDTSTPNKVSGYVDISSLEPLINQRNLLNAPVFARKTSDQTNMGTTFVDVTGLGLSVAANGVYWFKFMILADADAVTTGIDVTANGPAGATMVSYRQLYWTSATATGTKGANAYKNDTANTASNGTAVRVYEVEGILVNGATAGTLIPQAKREAVGSGPNVRAGSFTMLVKLN